jgi:SAM-dependent methyltransferase
MAMNVEMRGLNRRAGSLYLTNDAPHFRPYERLARHYDRVMGDKFFSKFCLVFESLMRLYPITFSSAADVACGTGAFVDYLARYSLDRLYGVDRSPEMLRIAISKHRGSRACLLLQDYAALRLPTRVDLIVCSFDSLNYLLTPDDLIRALSRFRTNMRPGGHLIFDMVTCPPVQTWWRPCLEQVSFGNATITRFPMGSPPGCTQLTRVWVADSRGTGLELHMQRGYTRETVRRSLQEAKLRIIGDHDFATLRSATERTSRIVYVAKAPV